MLDDPVGAHGCAPLKKMRPVKEGTRKMRYDPDRHHRRSIRLRGYDYRQPGAYFVTIVTQDRACLFGEVVGEEMHLNELGKIVWEEWFRSAEIRQEIELLPDEFVVMPNHVHGIVWIVESPVGAHGRAPLHHAPLQRLPRSLASFIAGFKSATIPDERKDLSVRKTINLLYGEDEGGIGLLPCWGGYQPRRLSPTTKWLSTTTKMATHTTYPTTFRTPSEGGRACDWARKVG
jgi:REP element-mobilizing transposase RayT